MGRRRIQAKILWQRRFGVETNVLAYSRARVAVTHAGIDAIECIRKDDPIFSDYLPGGILQFCKVDIGPGRTVIISQAKGMALQPAAIGHFDLDRIRRIYVLGEMNLVLRSLTKDSMLDFSQFGLTFDPASSLPSIQAGRKLRK